MGELIEDKGLVCLNNGQGTRVNLINGVESVLDLTLVSSELASGSKWDVQSYNSIGSDHYPITINFEDNIMIELDGVTRWKLGKADWSKFASACDEEFYRIDMSGEVDEINESIIKAILHGASQAIGKSSSRKKAKMVPWWNKECSEAIRNRNKMFRELKRNHSMLNLLDSKRAQAVVRKVIKRTKKIYWREFCSTIGRTTPLDKVWGMIKRMRGIRQDKELPVLKKGEEIACENMEKAVMLVKNFVKIHSSDNLTEEGKVRRQQTLDRYPEVLRKRKANQSSLDEAFTMPELRRALSKCKRTAPGKDNISYIMIEHLNDSALGKVLELFNKVWEEGKLPVGWKEAIIIPIKKPGKNIINPDSYRPIALTSHICKTMEKMITERITYYLERNELFTPFQSGFRRGRSTLDPLICLHDIRKAQSK